MFSSIFCNEKSHKRELKEHVGDSSSKKKKNVATITINIDTNDSKSDIIIVEDGQQISNNNESPKNEKTVEKFEGDTAESESNLKI